VAAVAAAPRPLRRHRRRTAARTAPPGSPAYALGDGA
jgi:hypothetical protein